MMIGASAAHGNEKLVSYIVWSVQKESCSLNEFENRVVKYALYSKWCKLQLDKNVNPGFLITMSLRY